MAEKSFFGVEGVARQLDAGNHGVEGVARELKEGFFGVEGVARKCFSSDATWHKYSCDLTIIETKYKRTDGGAIGTDKEVYVAVPFPIGESYMFSEGIGFSTVGGFTTSDPSDLPGRYYVSTAHEASVDGYDNCVIFINSAEWITGGEGRVAVLYGTITATAVKENTYSYSQGSTSYGEIVAPGGDIPEDGTLIEGSVEDGYLVIQIDSNYFYYVLEE